VPSVAAPAPRIITSNDGTARVVADRAGKMSARPITSAAIPIVH